MSIYPVVMDITEQVTSDLWIGYSAVVFLSYPYNFTTVFLTYLYIYTMVFLSYLYDYATVFL